MTFDPIPEFPQNEPAPEDFEREGCPLDDSPPECPSAEDFETGFYPAGNFRKGCPPPEDFGTPDCSSSEKVWPSPFFAPQAEHVKFGGRQEKELSHDDEPSREPIEATSSIAVADTLPAPAMTPPVEEAAKLGERRGVECPDRQKHDDALRRQFVGLPTCIMLDLRAGALSYRDVILYCYLLAKQGKNEALWWGVKKLSGMTGIPQTGVKESLRKLVRSGHIRRKRTRLSSRTLCLTRVIPAAEGGGLLIKGERVHIEKTPDRAEERR